MAPEIEGLAVVLEMIVVAVRVYQTVTGWIYPFNCAPKSSPRKSRRVSPGYAYLYPTNPERSHLPLHKSNITQRRIVSHKTLLGAIREPRTSVYLSGNQHHIHSIHGTGTIWFIAAILWPDLGRRYYGRKPKVSPRLPWQPRCPPQATYSAQCRTRGPAGPAAGVARRDTKLSQRSRYSTCSSRQWGQRSSQDDRGEQPLDGAARQRPRARGRVLLSWAKAWASLHLAPLCVRRRLL